MAQTIPPKIPTLSVGPILSASFSIFTERFFIVASMTALIFIPQIPLVIFSKELSNDGIPSLYAYFMLFIFSLLTPIVTVWIQGAITICAIQTENGEDFSYRDSLKKSLSRLLVYISILLLFFLIGIVVSLLFSVLVGILTVISRSNVDLILVFIYMICGLAVLLFLSSFTLIVPVCVMEKLTVKKSLARAQYLVKGNFWRVFLITLFCVLVAGLIGFFTSFIENAFTSQEGAMYLIGFFITRLIFVLPVSYILIVFALTYSELKLAKDEYDIEKAASIFD